MFVVIEGPVFDLLIGVVEGRRFGFAIMFGDSFSLKMCFALCALDDLLIEMNRLVVSEDVIVGFGIPSVS